MHNFSFYEIAFTRLKFNGLVNVERGQDILVYLNLNLILVSVSDKLIF